MCHSVSLRFPVHLFGHKVLTATKTKPETDTTHALYRQIPSAALQLLEGQDYHIHCLPPGESKPRLFFHLKQTLSEEQAEALEDREDLVLLVTKQNFSKFSQHLLKHVGPALNDDSLPVGVRFAMLQVAYADELERLFHKSRLENFVLLTQKIGRRISTLFQKNEISISQLHSYAHHYPTNYAHLTNVAAYAVILAKNLGQPTSADLNQIAVGCLLHEVGKLFQPSELQENIGRLSANDRQELERTPQLAYESLCEFGHLNLGQLMMAYQQFERVDGTGYPVRYLAADIHPWAKLLAVVDVFDAMTTARAYRPALGLRDVLVHIADHSNAHFDPEVVQCMITNFQSR